MSDFGFRVIGLIIACALFCMFLMIISAPYAFVLSFLIWIVVQSSYMTSLAVAFLIMSVFNIVRSLKK